MGKALYSKIIGLFICLVLSSCILETEVPENLIQKEEMSVILQDFLLKESMAYNLSISKDSQKVVFNSYYKPLIFKQHEISDVLFDSSMKFYMKHPELLDPISKKTEELLNEKLNSIKSNQ